MHELTKEQKNFWKKMYIRHGKCIPWYHEFDAIDDKWLDDSGYGDELLKMYDSVLGKYEWYFRLWKRKDGVFIMPDDFIEEIFNES